MASTVTTTVTMSRKNQIVVPREAREKLKLSPGQELLVLCKEDRIVLIPRPQDFVAKTMGLHKNIWSDGDTDSYLDQERASWDK